MINTIPAEIAKLIPHIQLEITRKHSEQFEDCLYRLALALEKCPAIGESDDLHEHPCIFHYFYSGTDLYISEYDKDDTMFGYTILNGDLPNAEWGYIGVSEITKIPQLNIDYHFEEQMIEDALYKAYPEFYKRPESLNIKV